MEFRAFCIAAFVFEIVKTLISFICFLLQVPFVLVEGYGWQHSDFVVVNMDGSRHPLPLTTIYHQLQPISASPYTFLQALFGHEYPVSLGNQILSLLMCPRKICFYLELESRL